MITIIVEKKFKSLSNPFNIVLPDFTVISGINGAGKSHLLAAIEQGIAKVYDDNGNELVRKRYINSSSLSPTDSYQVTRENLKSEIYQLHNSIQQFVQSKKNDPNLSFEKYLSYNPSQYHLTLKIANKLAIPFEDLTVEDINDNFPLNYGIVQDVFYQNFSQVFKRYFDKYEDNHYHEYLHNAKGKNVKYLSDSEFTLKYGNPPWEFVNRIFEESNIDYFVNDPIENDRDLPFTFKLINKTNGANVNFTDLSSGEKVLMSLALSLYNSKFDLVFPQVILFDEPDAPLHPSMAKQLLRVITEVFVKEKGVKVLMTTHSPSTVAMSPEESLFVMQRDEPRFLKKSKDQIMKLLTDGIPSFSIYADNRRQVFTESKVDADFYTKVYLKLKSVISSDKSLYFIPSGIIKGNSGNCEQVKESVKVLSNAGNQTVFGIIDWDKKNNNSDRVLVLGSSKRYSIENYIFDPIILASFLLREKIRERRYFGLEDDDNYFNIPKFSKAKIQSIVDVVISEISQRVNPIDHTRYMVYYHTGLSLEIPVWYLHHQGHELESIIRTTYPELNKFRKELTVEIIDKIIDDIPEFISVDILDLFQQLHL